MNVWTLTNSTAAQLSDSPITLIADTFERARKIDALRVSATQGELSHFDTFVDVTTISVRLESESLRADAVTKARAGEGAFLVLGTGLRAGTVPAHQDAVVALSHVRCLAATMAEFAKLTVFDAGSASRTLLVTGALHQIGVAD